MNTQQAELTVHEMLREICDKIWYEFHSLRKEVIWKIQSDWTELNIYVDVNEREIIFTQEFMEKFREFYLSKINDNFDNLDKKELKLLNHLHNPVKYLYNLIK